MSKSFINRKINTITQSAHMPHSAYKALAQLGIDHNADIAKNPKGFLILTFGSVETAENVANRFRADYAAAHKAYVPKSEREPAQQTKSAKNPKSKPSQKGKPSPSEKKMTLDEFIKSKPSCTREEAKAYGFTGTKADLKAKKVELGVR